ncbi:MAG: response regulator [Candidatus Omnitrophica bacterium]|nr:response regulator [Candidatus Omnitrophota bacterium]
MSKKKILFIDDSVNLLQALKARLGLEMEDVEVLMAYDGNEGIALARAQKPDLIFLDINMPNLNGDEVLKQLKSSDASSTERAIPIIILTSYGPELRDRYIAAGATDYMTSPFDSGELIQRVKQLLNYDDSSSSL